MTLTYFRKKDSCPKPDNNDSDNIIIPGINVHIIHFDDTQISTTIGKLTIDFLDLQIQMNVYKSLKGIVML